MSGGSRPAAPVFAEWNIGVWNPAHVLSGAGNAYQVTRSRLGQKIIEQSPKNGGGWLPVSLHRLGAGRRVA
jgi:hypothetical protein